MIQRKPIKVIRKSIRLSKNDKLKIKLIELNEESRDEDILNIANYYSLLLIKRTGDRIHFDPFYNYTDPKKHKNWMHFEMLYEMCLLKHWDSNKYLDIQFNPNVQWVNGKFQYPLPNMLCCMSAIRRFSEFIGDAKQKYKHDLHGERKEKGNQIDSIQKEIVDGIIKSIQSLDFYIKNSKYEDKSQFKAIKIFQSWQEFSPYYLWSIDWFRSVLYRLNESSRVEEYKNIFKLIKRSSELQHHIDTTVSIVEQEFNIPPNIDLF